VFFIIPTIAYAAYKRQKVLLTLAVFLLVCSPWFVRNILEFGDPLYTSSRYLSIMSNIEEYHAFSPPTHSGYLQKVGLVGAVTARLINMVTSYVPPPHKALEYGVTWTLSYPLIGIITPAVLAVGLIAAIVYRRNPLVIIILLASALAPITMGFPRANGVSIDNLSPIVPLAGILAFGWLHQTKRRGWMLTLMLLLLMQGVFLFSQYPHEPNRAAIDEARNLPDGSKVMSRDAYMFAFYLPDKNITWVTTPFCTPEELQQFIKEQRIDYYIATDADKNRG
jgi:hypothetical protein